MRTAELADARPRRAQRARRSRGWASATAPVLVTVALLLGWAAIDRRISEGFAGALAPRAGGAALLAAGVAFWIVRARTWLYEEVTSVRFGVVLMLFLLGATILGTVVLQAPEVDIVRQYPGGVARFLLALELNDLFHSAWFRGLLALLGVSLSIVPIRRQAWRPPMWGHLLCHVGTVVILVGGVVGTAFGRKAWLELHEGESASAVVASDSGERGEVLPLGFELRLLDFEVEHHERETGLNVFAVGREGLVPVGRFDPRDERAGSGFDDVDSLGSSFRVVAVQEGAVDVEIRNASGARRKTLRAGSGDMAWLAEGRTILAYDRRPSEVKAYRSRVAVVENGREVLRKTIEVNDPLAYGGWHVYQSSWKQEDPTWSGFQVVRDPGFGTVFLGFAMIACGVLFVYYVRPRLLHRRPA